MRLAAAVLVLAASCAHVPPGHASRSPLEAFAWSAVPTAAGYGLLALVRANQGPPGTYSDLDAVVSYVGVALTAAGPSLGHVYAEDNDPVGPALRAIGAVVGVIGGLGEITACEEEPRPLPLFASCHPVQNVGTGLFMAGAAWDVVSAPIAADLWNGRHADDAPAITVTPSAIPTPAGPAPALTVGGWF